MSLDSSPPVWRDPEYVSVVVGVLATGALVFYAALSSAAPSVETVVLVLLWVTLPMTVAHELVRRLS